MIAAQLAYEQLSPEQQRHAVEILQCLPNFDYDIGPQTADLPPDLRAMRIFQMAAIWPDLIKNDKHPSHKESRPGWHVTWLPLPVQGYKVPPQAARAGRPNTLDALPIQMRDFATSTSLSPERKAIALAWILHLVGDLHQPLHSVALYSKQWPAGDHSGSSFYVRPRKGEPATPLHKVWDGLFGGRDISTTGIAALARNIAHDPKLQRDDFPTELAKKTVQEWIEESREVARREAYRLDTTSPIHGLPEIQAKKADATGGEVPQLPDGYIQHAKIIARRQEALAGDRISDFLRKAL
jgi:hypothetical protein